MDINETLSPSERSEGLAAGWTFKDVEERLIEAWQFLRRMPDREASFLRTATMSIFRQAVPDREGKYDDTPPSRPGLRTAEVERMNEALGWVEQWVRASDRRIIALALSQLAADQASVEWIRMWQATGLGSSPDALRKRYDRAIRRIATALNALIS